MEPTDKQNPLRLATVTELPPRSTAALDLANLPERLTDEQLMMVRAMAEQPLPELLPCDERHLAMCLRMMLAVLPRQQTDEIGGELFVAAYERQLGGYCDDAISWLSDKAMQTCRWFPTIAECLDLLEGWYRNDEHVQRRNLARSLAYREQSHRNRPLWKRTLPPPLTQEAIDSLPDPLVRIGLSAGWLVQDEGGKIVAAPDEAA